MYFLPATLMAIIDHIVYFVSIMIIKQYFYLFFSVPIFHSTHNIYFYEALYILHIVFNFTAYEDRSFRYNFTTEYYITRMQHCKLLLHSFFSIYPNQVHIISRSRKCTIYTCKSSWKNCYNYSSLFFTLGRVLTSYTINDKDIKDIILLFLPCTVSIRILYHITAGLLR